MYKLLIRLASIESNPTGLKQGGLFSSLLAAKAITTAGEVAKPSKQPS